MDSSVVVTTKCNSPSELYNMCNKNSKIIFTYNKIEYVLTYHGEKYEINHEYVKIEIPPFYYLLEYYIDTNNPKVYFIFKTKEEFETYYNKNIIKLYDDKYNETSLPKEKSKIEIGNISESIEDLFIEKWHDYPI